jgi:hypothetical protein
LSVMAVRRFMVTGFVPLVKSFAWSFYVCELTQYHARRRTIHAIYNHWVPTSMKTDILGTREQHTIVLT